MDFTYSGKWGVQKEEYNLYYMRDRYYSSELHRFLSLDKDQGDLYRPSTLNPYAYVGNDPINFIDPSGMVAINFGNAVKDFALASVGAILGVGELAFDGTMILGGIVIGGLSIGAMLATDIASKIMAGITVAANMIISSLVFQSSLVAKKVTDAAKRTWTTGKEIGKKVYEAADNIRRVVDIAKKLPQFPFAAMAKDTNGNLNIPKEASEWIKSEIYNDPHYQSKQKFKDALRNNKIPQMQPYVHHDKSYYQTYYPEWIGKNMSNYYIGAVSDPSLKKYIGEIYRGNSVIGDGGTADVWMFEQVTGVPVSRATHKQKVQDTINSLNDRISSGILSASDEKIAREILNKLQASQDPFRY